MTRRQAELVLDEADPAWVGGDWPEYHRLHQEASREAARADAGWLARSPKTTRYVRPSVAHELCVEGEPCRVLSTWIRVWFPRPGVRLRREAQP